jgi:hypothetical protein
LQLFPVSLFADSVIDNHFFGYDFNALRLSQQRKDQVNSKSSRLSLQQQQQQQQQQHQDPLSSSRSHKNDQNQHNHSKITDFELNVYPNIDDIDQIPDVNEEPQEYDILLAQTTPRHRSTSISTGFPVFHLNKDHFSHKSSSSLLSVSNKSPTNTTHNIPPSPSASIPYPHNHPYQSPALSTTHSIAPSVHTIHTTYATDHNNLIVYTDEQLIPPKQRCLRLFLQNFHRITAVLICVSIALIFPQFSLIIALFGSFTNALLAYILPAFFWIRICSHHILYKEKLKIVPKITKPEIHFVPKSPHSTSINRKPLIKPGKPLPVINEPQVIPAELYNRVIWFPYSRSGEPTQPLLSLYDNPFDNQEEVGLLGEKQTLLQNTSFTRPQLPQRELSYKIKALLVPYLVAIAGSFSSFIGVSAALKDLIEQFGKPVQ